ncbi:hypothetical protein [Micromonospora purpureochromogenes]|uniref:Uncharacterized protein n=1 Tax=Micromonospora purpureochromogenes TaxID=47872 RepID=A0ABX2RLJ6_9ACTN|nr:hypothetical protein [Micromonospora purpureochromogenes]NYF57216.1 hypothetical protein [Micromonospora purpureochromogenes]
MRWVRLVGLGLAGAAAVLWAVGMTVLQPLAEPLGPWSEQLPGSTTYWPRDVRFLAIAGVVLGLVLAGAGDRRWTGRAVLLGAGWVAADVAFDRADVAGVTATVLLCAVGWTVIGLLAGVPARRQGWPGRPAHWRRRRALGLAAAVAATLVLVAGLLDAPPGQASRLDRAAVPTGLLLLTAAVGCALAAAPSTRGRRGWAAATATVGAVGLVALRLLPPDRRTLPLLALGTLLLTGTTLLSWDRPGGRPAWRRHALAGAGALVGLPMAGFASLVVTSVPVGAVLTDWAGNLPLADLDRPLSLLGLLTGLLLGLVLAWPNALGYRPEPTAPTGPADPSGPAGPAGAPDPSGPAGAAAPGPATP